MALAGDILLDRRGENNPRAEFGYAVPAGEIVYRGSLVALNVAGNIVRVQTAGALGFLGVANKRVDNRSGSAASTDLVVPERGTFAIVVPIATFTNVAAAATVYAVDDGTVTLTNTGSLLAIGTLAGIENGATWVNLGRIVD
nr:hypothetical protein [uncultured Rhodopila sp.]